MKTFYELDTMPKVGDLIMKKSSDGWDNPVIYLVTKIIGDTYHIHKQGHSLHARHLASYYSPLAQETQ